MGCWCHPDISLEELLALIKGFVDTLVLACGYQSSGLPATWDVRNIKMAFQWGIFFQHVFRRLEGSPYYEASVKELDAALLSLTSDPLFPQGLRHLTSATLSTARDLILKHLLQTHPLKDMHLTALLTAIIEMEIDNLSKTDIDGPKTYIDNLMLQMESLNLAHVREGVIKNSIASSAASGSGDPDGLDHRACSHEMLTESIDVSKECCSADHSRFVIQEIIKRQAFVSCISSVEMGINTVSQIVTRTSLLVSEKNPSEAHTPHVISPKKEFSFTELDLWNRWRSRCLTYLLDKRTIRLLSGANLIFSAPRVQWIRILEPLKISVDIHDENLLEIVEIFLLGFISRRWNLLIEHFSSHSCNFTPLSKQYSDLCHLLQENSEYFHFKREPMSSKEKDVFEYLMQLFRTQPHILWQVPPVLAAAAFPPWSILFRMYMDDIEKQFNEASSLSRCRGCSQHGKDHEDCEVSERIRCLHVFHVQGLHLMARITKMFLSIGNTKMFGKEKYQRQSLTLGSKQYVLPMRQAMRKLRAQWRRKMKLRQNQLRFGYDLESYSRNFDDGCQVHVGSLSCAS